MLWDAAEGEPAFSVFSGQHSLPCNLPAAELSLSSALKAPLAPADFVHIPILMLQWNEMKNGFCAGNRVLLWGKINSQKCIYWKDRFLSVWLVRLFSFCCLLQKALETVKYRVTLAFSKRAEISPLTLK